MGANSKERVFKLENDKKNIKFGETHKAVAVIKVQLKVKSMSLLKSITKSHIYRMRILDSLSKSWNRCSLRVIKVASLP